MNIQMFGVKNSFDVRKAERFFSERKIKVQYIDLAVKGLSKGELQSVCNALGLEALINQQTKNYKKLNMDKITGAAIREEILFDNPQLYKTPIVRNGKQATVGYVPEIWQTWIEADK